MSRRRKVYSPAIFGLPSAQIYALMWDLGIEKRKVEGGRDIVLAEDEVKIIRKALKDRAKLK